MSFLCNYIWQICLDTVLIVSHGVAENILYKKANWPFILNHVLDVSWILCWFCTVIKKQKKKPNHNEKVFLKKYFNKHLLPINFRNVYMKSPYYETYMCLYSTQNINMFFFLKFTLFLSFFKKTLYAFIFPRYYRNSMLRLSQPRHPIMNRLFLGCKTMSNMKAVINKPPAMRHVTIHLLICHAEDGTLLRLHGKLEL